MKCTLELYGKTYESTEFSDRHVFGMVASASAGGINLKSLFERALGGKDIKESTLGKAGLDTLFNDYDMEAADRNIAYILKTIFPTFDKPLKNVDTASLVEIISAMVRTLVSSDADPEKMIEPISEPSKALGLVPTIKTVDVQPIVAIDPIEWVYPTVSIPPLTPQEDEALDYASQVSRSRLPKMQCWYAWWKAVNDGESVSTAVAIEVLLDFTKQFTEQECGRYYALITAHLEKSVAPAIDTPIAA